MKNEVFNEPLFFDILKKINECTEMSVKDAYTFTKFSDEINQKFKFYITVYKKLLNKYGIKEGENYKFTDENLKKFNEEFKQLLEEEFIIKVRQKIKFPDIIKIAPKQIELLNDYFKFD